MKNFILNFLKALIIFSYSICWSQIETKLEPEQILIGDTASLSITVTTDSRNAVLLPQVGDSLNNYLLVSKIKTDTLQRGNNLNLIHRLTITGFDPGKYIVNSLPVAINGDTIFSDTKYLEVVDVPVDINQEEIYPIKSNFEVKITWWERYKKYLWYMIIGGLVILAIILIVILYLRELKRKRYDDEVILPPYEEAILHLKKLDRKSYLEGENYYAYYSELSIIIRRYFARRFMFDALALLKDDLPAYMLRKEYLNDEESQQLKQFLIDADQVKYAKSDVALEQSEIYREWIEKMINHTRPIVEEEVPDHI